MLSAQAFDHKLANMHGIYVYIKQRISQIYILKYNGATYWFYRFISLYFSLFHSLPSIWPNFISMSYDFPSSFFSGDDVYWECKGKVDASFFCWELQQGKRVKHFLCFVLRFLLFHSTPIQVEYVFFPRSFSRVLTRPRFTYNLERKKNIRFCEFTTDI